MQAIAHDLDNLGDAYKSLENPIRWVGPEGIRSDYLLSLPLAGEAAPEPIAGKHEIRIETDEFTAVCPWTGLPDFGRLEVSYLPDARIVELKSLKYYLLSYHTVGVVQEQAAERIADDLFRLLSPRSLAVRLDYKPRGGIHTVSDVKRP